MKNIPIPAKDYLLSCFDYNQESGILVWQVRPEHHFGNTDCYPALRVRNAFNGQYAGTIAGRLKYNTDKTPHAVVVKLNSVALYAHRIIYNLMVGPIPEGMVIDHENRNPFDNGWKNLRLATQFQNMSNQILQPNKISKLPKGVVRHWNRFAGQIVFHNKHIYLGTFTTADEAHAAYCAKARELKGEFARFY